MGGPVPALATSFEFFKVTLGVTSHAFIASEEVGVVPSTGATIGTCSRLCPVPVAAMCTGCTFDPVPNTDTGKWFTDTTVEDIPVGTTGTITMGATPRSVPTTSEVLKFATEVCTVIVGIMVPTEVSIFASILFSRDLGVFSGVSPSPFPLIPFRGLKCYGVFLRALRRGNLSPFVVANGGPFWWFSWFSFSFGSTDVSRALFPLVK